MGSVFLIDMQSEILFEFAIFKSQDSKTTFKQNPTCFYTRLPVKFVYPEKTTNFCEISIVDLSYLVTIKSTIEILQNYVVAVSEYMNFTKPPSNKI